METTLILGLYRGYTYRCQNYGPFLGTQTIRCCIILGTQKGTIKLTTTHMHGRVGSCWGGYVGGLRRLDAISLRSGHYGGY